jgi:hypothetical protein
VKKLFRAILICGFASCLLAGDETKVAGNWQMTFQSPHGDLQVALRIEQDGSKLSGTYELQALGSLPVTGSVEGNRVSFEVQVKEQEVTLAYTGTIDGNKMSGTMKPGDRNWSATRQ